MDYDDNSEHFAFFSRACVQMCFSLQGVMRSRAKDLSGILNGLDQMSGHRQPTAIFRSASTILNYQERLSANKDLQRNLGLSVRDDVPLFAFVFRFAFQKGINMLAEAIPSILSMDVQLVLPGTGEIWTHFYH